MQLAYENQLQRSRLILSWKTHLKKKTMQMFASTIKISKTIFFEIKQLSSKKRTGYSKKLRWSKHRRNNTKKNFKKNDFNNHFSSNKSQVTINSEPIDDNHAVTKSYVDSSSENDRNKKDLSKKFPIKIMNSTIKGSQSWRVLQEKESQIKMKKSQTKKNIND